MRGKYAKVKRISRAKTCGWSAVIHENTEEDYNRVPDYTAGRPVVLYSNEKSLEIF